MAYPTASLQNDLDRLARIRQLLDAALGDGTDDDTAAMGGALILVSVLDEEDYDINDALMDAAHDAAEALKTASSASGQTKTAQSLVAGYVRALRTHFGNDLDAELTAEAIQVHPQFNTLYYEIFGSYLTAGNVYPLNTELGRVDKAAGVWTFTDDSAVDTDVYAPSQCEIYVPATYTIGVADCVLTVTLVKSDATTEDQAVTMPGGSVAGTAVAIDTATDVYVDASTATVTGGTDGDRVAIRTKLLRSIATACNA